MLCGRQVAGHAGYTKPAEQQQGPNVHHILVTTWGHDTSLEHVSMMMKMMTVVVTLCCFAGGVQAMLDAGYTKPAEQQRTPHDDDILEEASTSGRDAVPADRQGPCAVHAMHAASAAPAEWE